MLPLAATPTKVIFLQATSTESLSSGRAVLRTVQGITAMAGLVPKAKKAATAKSTQTTDKEEGKNLRHA
jgi:hypothetical protein